jgi:hypothetical protein
LLRKKSDCYGRIICVLCVNIICGHKKELGEV